MILNAFGNSLVTCINTLDVSVIALDYINLILTTRVNILDYSSNFLSIEQIF